MHSNFPTISALKSSACAGRNKAVLDAAEKQVTHEKRKLNKSLSEMKGWLKVLGIAFEEEYKFDKKRKFRFDIAIMTKDKMIGIEYEGLFSNKSRHTTAAGYTKDTDKYRLAAMQGWLILRYTKLNYKNFLIDIQELIK